MTDVGRVLVGQARTVLCSAARFEALAAGLREGLEPELAVAIDPLVPTAAFIHSLHALRLETRDLPVSFSTEGLGGAERNCAGATPHSHCAYCCPVCPTI